MKASLEKLEKLEKGFNLEGFQASQTLTFHR
jgi:hypothetical protein